METTTRKVVKRSPAHTVRLLHLPQLQEQPVEADSAPERDFVHIAALYPFIARIDHQPFKLVWEDASYTPDFLLTFCDQSRLVVEVKPSDRVGEYHELFERAAQKLEANGYQFYVATDTKIHASGRSANALLIRRYAKTRYPSAACQALLARVNEASKGVTVADLCDAEGHSLSVLRHLITKRLLAPQPDLGTQPQSTISIPHSSKGQSHALQFSSWFDA